MVIVEGETLVADAVAAGWEVEAQFVAPDGRPVPEAGGVVHELAPGVMERVATTETPRPLIAIVRRRPWTWSDVPAARFVVVADRVADPGNLGTILRSAEASGADAVLVTPGTVDPYAPKTVRASAGAVFNVPLMSVAELADLRRHGLEVVGTSSHRGERHTVADLTRPTAVVLGNEAHGLPDDADVDRWITVAHEGRAESLNVAMAATVVCFEALRQRTAAPR